ncbi:MAG: TRAP transporter small permease [Burkholderiales bacterium]|nr:TRAP transporter small permease [Burkholderiales bacterium]
MNPDQDDAPSTAAPALSRVHLLLGRVETWFNLVAALFIFGLMLLGMAQVLGRTLFNVPMYGYIDFVEISIATFAFLGIAYCQRVGGHVRMELFLKMAKGRPQFAMEIAGILIGLFVIGVLTWYGFEHFLRAYRFGDSTIDAELPVWPSKLVVPVSFALLWLRLLVQLAGYTRLWRDPQAEPVAVPRVMTAEDIAAREIEESAQRG